MAGHRQQSGRPTRTQSRQDRNRNRLASATTAEEQLAAAYDWFRMSARRVKDVGARGARIRHVAEFLASTAIEIDREANGPR